MKKKIISIMMAAVMIFSMSTAFSFAGDTSSKIIVNSSGDKLIPEDVAEIIAERFITDIAAADLDMTWTDDTEVDDCTVLYDENNDISGYSFDLETAGEDNGYIVISAYTDIENQILEYSDSCDPLYESLDLDAGDKVIYTGTLDYYKDTGNSYVVSLDNKTVAKTQLKSDFEACRSASYQLSNRIEMQNALSGESYTTDSDDGVDLDGTIYNAVDYANANYAGPFSAYEWDNHLEQYCKFTTMGSFSGYVNHCSPTAITNLIQMKGAYAGNSNITNKSYRTIFSTVAQYGINQGYYKNASADNDGGTSTDKINQYIKESFNLFGVNVSVTNKIASYNNVKVEISNNRPIYLTLLAGGDTAYTEPDLGHDVIGYAYTRLKSSTTGNYKSFLKVADGWYSHGRYIDLAMTASTSDAILRSVA